MARTATAVALLLSLGACGRLEPASQDAQAGAATMLGRRLAPDSVAGGGNHYNVWPTGDSALDVANVQWAIDHVAPGGVVMLKATDKRSGAPAAFEFGDGSVNLTTSVSVRGEVDDVGSPLALVRGGNRPFFCDDASVALEIANLRFDGPRRAAIHVRQSAAATLTGNVIVNMVASKELAYAFPVLSYAATGIEMGSLSCQTPDPLLPNKCLDPALHLGPVEITSNFIDAGIYGDGGQLLDPTVVYPNAKADGTPLEDTAFSGIVLTGCEVTANISGNIITNTNRRAIHPLDTFGSTTIVGNSVEMAPFSSSAPGTASPGGNGKRNYGIFPLNGHRKVEAITSGAVHTVAGNTVTVASDVGQDGPHGVGILGGNAFHDSALIDNTVIFRPGARNAVVLAGNVSAVALARTRYNTIARNTIDTSAYVPQPIPGRFTPALIVASFADSTTIDTNTYVGSLPTLVILGSGTGAADASHPNTIVDPWCGTAKIQFDSSASCTQP